MKIVRSTLFCLVLIAGIFAAQEKRAGAAAPQPRVRLMPTPKGTVARVEKPAISEPGTGTVLMEKMVVTGSRLSSPTGTAPQEPDSKHFSLRRGGPMIEGKIGTLPFAAGLWASDELFKEDAKFRPQKTRVDVDFLRIKW